jgi:hypothetical protein
MQTIPERCNESRWIGNLCQQSIRSGEHQIACAHSNGVSIRHPDTGLAATNRGAVEQVVLHKRRIVEKFTDGSGPYGICWLHAQSDGCIVADARPDSAASCCELGAYGL